MAKTIDINERMKVFKGLEGMSKENLEKGLKAIQIAQETNENTEMSEELKIDIPKGAGSKVDEVALQIVKDKGFDYLDNIAKINFKNTDKIKEML